MGRRRARPLKRRTFVGSLAAAAGAPGLVQSRGSARLTIHPREPEGSLSPGLVPLGVAEPRDAWLAVPEMYDPSRRWPLLVALHGATQSHQFMVRILGDAAQAHGVLLLLPNSGEVTWDAILGRFGPDVELLDRAVAAAMQRANVDPERLLLAGFSDGATYALGLGRANGDVFHRIAAFSPGFIARSDSPDRGRPRMFVSHGRQDVILPIDLTGRRVVTQLRHDGYSVRFEEFDGPHGVPPAIADLAMGWLV